MNAHHMTQLNDALEIALSQSKSDPQAFAFQLTAALAGWMSQGFLSESVAMKSIKLLRQLHPHIKL